VSAPDRYEPLPSLPELPRWVWRKIGRRGRFALVGCVVLLIAAAAAAVPILLAEDERRTESDARAAAERRTELVRSLREEQRPRERRSASVAAPGAPDAEQLAARAAVMKELPAAILADARARASAGELKGPIRRVDCEPFPRPADGARGPEGDLAQRRGRYSCIAVTSEFGRTEESVGGVLGHTYRALVDFRSGRYAFCKVSGQAGPSREQLVTTPRACGG
jgi:hypothetical protein